MPRRRTLVALILAVLAQTTLSGTIGYELHHLQHLAPICIKIDPNGAPAPDTCTDPNSYQVGIGY